MALRIVSRMLALFVLIIPASGQLPAQIGPNSASTSAFPSDQTRHDTPASAPASDLFMTKLTPHPYIFCGPSLMGAGYSTLAYRGESGISVESTRFLGSFIVGYDDGHQRNDGNQPNPKGHDRYMDLDLGLRLAESGLLGKLFFGLGERWNELSTTKYTKTANRPQFGGGFDIVHHPCSRCGRDFSMRFQVDWVTTGDDWQNGSHGPDITIFLPSPRERRHVFYRQSFAVYLAHATVTDRSNRPLVQSEQADRAFTFYANFGLFYRF